MAPKPTKEIEEFTDEELMARAISGEEVCFHDAQLGLRLDPLQQDLAVGRFPQPDGSACLALWRHCRCGLWADWRGTAP